MADKERFKNGMLVKTISHFQDLFQVCGYRENFMGGWYEVVVLRGDVYPVGEIISIVDDQLFEVKESEIS